MRYAVNVPNFEDYSDVRTVAALATERLRLGPMVTPLARRRPWKLARETVTLGRLSGGRLEVLVRLWSGETVSFAGRHYRVDQVAFQPTPVQRPRIPIWVAGAWPRRGPLRRAARGMLEPLAEAGMTWWQECVDPRQTDLAAFRRRVRQGPPGA